jgi:flagellar operon protein
MKWGMTMKTYKLTHAYQLHQPQLNKPLGQSKRSTASVFSQHLQQALQQQELKFSEHAKARLQERGIELSSELVERLNSGLQKAKQKGARDSLMLTEDTAFVVSVKNQTVITAMSKDALEEQVITNIDSAVLL